MKKNNKGFTLVELLAVIVVLAIVMGLAAVAITGVLNNTRKSAFVADAKSFINGARSLVNADGVNSMLGASTGNFAPSCVTASTKYIPLETIQLESGGIKSPYNNNYAKGTGTTAVDTAPATSYIEVTSVLTVGNCSYTYKIFLSDGVYAIGSSGATIAEADLDASDVTVITAGTGE